MRERVDAFADKESFQEFGSIAGIAKYNPDGSLKSYTPANFIAGKATVQKRPVIVAADDFSIRAGHADGSVWGKSVKFTLSSRKKKNRESTVSLTVKLLLYR